MINHWKAVVSLRLKLRRQGYGSTFVYCQVFFKLALLLHRGALSNRFVTRLCTYVCMYFLIGEVQNGCGLGDDAGDGAEATTNDVESEDIFDSAEKPQNQNEENKENENDENKPTKEEDGFEVDNVEDDNPQAPEEQEQDGKENSDEEENDEKEEELDAEEGKADDVIDQVAKNGDFFVGFKSQILKLDFDLQGRSVIDFGSKHDVDAFTALEKIGP